MLIRSTCVHNLLKIRINLELVSINYVNRVKYYYERKLIISV